MDQKYTPRNFAELKAYIKQDYEIINGRWTWKGFLTSMLFEAGVKFVFWLRLTRYFWLKSGAWKVLFVLSRFILKHYAYKYSFDISYRTQIGPGLNIAHFGYIVVPSHAVIGENCALRPGVIIGKKLSRSTGGATIGNNVSFGVGSKVVGEVTIGDNVIIGANAVVTKDIPSDCIAAGIPARVIRRTGQTVEAEAE